MNVTVAVKNYIKSVDLKAREFYQTHKVPHFINPSFTSSEVQERIMRLGTECRFTGAQTKDELYLMALATLHDDYIKHHDGTYVSLVPLRNVWDVKSIFADQLKTTYGRLYFMHYDADMKVSVVCIEYGDYDTILRDYTYAEVKEGRIPTLRKHSR